MSAGDGGPGRREVAYRLFAAEYDDADFSYSESDEERAPNYVVTPTGARVNRLFAVGVLTETEPVNEEMLRARVVDPTGAFVVYAGQYQPDALAFLERAETPSFLAVTGKARTFQPEDSDRVYTSVRPESISEVDGDTRDRWVVQAAERTLERVKTTAAAIESGLSDDALREALEADGVEPSLAAGVPLALDHYGSTPEYLAAVERVATDALEVVAGEREEVRPLDVSPGEGGGDASALAGRDLAIPAGTGAAEGAGSSEGAGESATDGSPERDASTTDSTAEREVDAGGPAADDVGEVSGPGGGEAAVGDSASTGDVGETTDGTESVGEPAETEGVSEFDPDEEFDPETDVLSDEERAEAEELGGFSTGNQVEEPAEAAADESVDVASEEADAATSGEPEAEPAGEPRASTGSGSPVDDREDADADVSLEDALMDAMTDLDDGDGAPRDALVDAVIERTGASEADVDAAIEDALMSGQCYEPDDDVLKPI